MTRQLFRMTSFVALTLAAFGYGNDFEVELTPSGFGAYNIGQVVQANPSTAANVSNAQVDHILFQQMFLGMNIKVDYNPLPFTTYLGAELKALTEVPRSQVTSQDQGLGTRLFYFFYLTRMDMVYSLNDAFNIDFGYFPYKYNEDSRNLGEYLFRTGTYPQYIITSFDFSAARLMGLNLFGTLFRDGSLLSDLNYSLIADINLERATMGDLNVSGIASVSLFNRLLEIGGGFSLNSLVSAFENRTQPDTTVAIPEYNPNGLYIDKNGDTTTYTFAGTKLMARLSIDPKALFSTDIFGKEDLKLYAEAAILGLKDYPVSLDTSYTGTRYDDILKRMPVMFGFNFPTFKILDVLSMEWEWFGSIYPNDMTSYIVEGLPVPISTNWKNNNSSGPYQDSAADNWKWSIYAKKTFAKHFFAVFQVANDHYRWDCSADYILQSKLLSEALTQKKHKYYVVKLGYQF